MRIWITRAQPEAEATAQRLRALGHEPVVAPLLEVQPLGASVDLEGVVALAFTSRNGVRAFAASSPERNLKVFTVGDATAAAARGAGFADVSSAAGDALALAELIARGRAALGGVVLYLAPEEPAGDLAGALAALAAQGVPARTQAVYRTQPPAAPAAVPPGVDLVLIHSAKAARRLAEDPALAETAPSMTAVCISPAAAEPLAGLGFRDVLVAPQPTEAALIQTLDAWAVRQAPIRLFPPLYWVVIGFGLICIVAAVLVVGLGPRLFPARVKPPAPAHGSAASIPRKFGLRPASPSGPP
ncbi:MAG TPA: uroporphyrinogen-III synthase [Caulobacteraceae bacterium]